MEARTAEGKFIKGISYSPETQFKKGVPSDRKGKKFPGTGNKATWKKGNLPHNTLHDGAIVTRKDRHGVLQKLVRLSLGKWEKLYRVNWEKANGPIPKNMILRCKTEDTLNCDPSNWMLITRSEHATLNRWKGHTATRREKEIRFCIVCNSELTGNAKKKFCSRECSNKHFNDKQKLTNAAKRVESYEITCKQCGKNFSTENLHVKYCSDECRKQMQLKFCHKYYLKKQEERPMIAICLNCKIKFDKVRVYQKFCSDKCREIRKQKQKKQYNSNYTETIIKEKSVVKCLHCSIEFEQSHKLERYCSAECRKAVKNKKRRVNKPKVERVKKQKPVIHSTQLNKKKLRAEKVLVENMPELNQTVKHDGDRLKARGIKSPDLSTIELRHYDPVMKTTRFFKTPERYEKYLQTLNK